LEKILYAEYSANCRTVNRHRFSGSTADPDPDTVTGPLAGLSIVEFAGIGPAPFATMMLSDLGATVIRIDRPGTGFDGPTARSDVVSRGRRSIALNLKSDAGTTLAQRLVANADILIEGFRPGTMERLGLGPDECLAANPGLVYGRMTGWGQSGPLAARAGHDINYVGLSGALHSIGRAGEAPVPPLNLVGDYGGGGMLLAFGVLAAVFVRERTGLGQVVDAAMVDGSTTLMAAIYGLRGNGQWNDERGTNLLDSGTPYYDVYQTSDGQYMAVGALEPQFFAELVRLLELDPTTNEMHLDQRRWPELRAILTAAFQSKTRAEWTRVFDGTDACVTPVLSMAEAPLHPHNVERGNLVSHLDLMQPAPSPRFSESSTKLLGPPPHPGEHTVEILSELGIDSVDAQNLLDGGIVDIA
jgi:alpha-methylacyl-CoA racemase